MNTTQKYTKLKHNIIKSIIESRKKTGVFLLLLKLKQNNSSIHIRRHYNKQTSVW